MVDTNVEANHFPGIGKMVKNNNRKFVKSINEKNMTIVEVIQLGLRRGYYQNRQLGGEWEGFDDKMVEYLLTVFVAIELNNYSGFGKPCKVNLEYPLWLFYNNAFPLYKWTNQDTIEALMNGSEQLKRQYSKDRSKERIDIVISFQDEILSKLQRSLHGIELKAIKEYYSDIKKDIDRLAKSMTTVDPGTGDSNSINTCYSAFIKAYGLGDNEASEANLKARQAAIKKEIEDFLSNEHRLTYPTLKFIVHADSIDRESEESYLERYSGVPDAEVSPDEVRNATGEVLGIVIEIARQI